MSLEQDLSGAVAGPSQSCLSRTANMSTLGIPTTPLSVHPWANHLTLVSAANPIVYLTYLICRAKIACGKLDSQPVLLFFSAITPCTDQVEGPLSKRNDFFFLLTPSNMQHYTQYVSRYCSRRNCQAGKCRTIYLIQPIPNLHMRSTAMHKIGACAHHFYCQLDPVHHGSKAVHEDVHTFTLQI